MRRGVLARRVALATGCLTFLLMVLGCMGLSIDRRQEIISKEDGSSAQSGEVKVAGEQELDVYYPVPFVSPPNLSIADDNDRCVVAEQFPDHFRVKNSWPFSAVVTWKARGVTAGPRPTILPVPPASSPTQSSPPTGPPVPVVIGPPTQQPEPTGAK